MSNTYDAYLRRHNGTDYDIVRPKTTWANIIDHPTTYTASQITAGVFDVARIPNITVSKITDIATNYSAISHKYHAFSNGQYFYDSISNDNFFQLFTNNFECDSIRFQTIYSVEYYNHSTSAWKTWTGGEANIKLLLDGNSSTGFSLDHTHRTFRFVTSRRSWPLNSLVVLQDTWTGLTRTNSGVKIEVATSSSPASWTSKLDITFGGSGWGTYSYYTNALHSGDGYVRITIDFTDWTDSDSYTTFPLRRFMLLHNYNPLAGYMTPITWDYDRKITVQSLNSVGAISEGGTALASKYLQIANLTASAIITALGTTAVNRATADASGNTITSTYLTQASAASTYAPISHTHTSSQITDLLNTAHTFTADQTYSGYLKILGTAADGHLKTRGIKGSNTDGTDGDLYLNYSYAHVTHWGTSAQGTLGTSGQITTSSTISATGNISTSGSFSEGGTLLSSKYLTLSGGALTGPLNTHDIFPHTNDEYVIGSFLYYYTKIYGSYIAAHDFYEGDFNSGNNAGQYPFGNAVKLSDKYALKSPTLLATLTASTSTHSAYSTTTGYLYYVEVDYTESSITYTATLTLRANQMTGIHAFLFKEDSSFSHIIIDVNLTSGSCSAGSSCNAVALIADDINSRYSQTIGNIRIYSI